MKRRLTVLLIAVLIIIQAACCESLEAMTGAAFAPLDKYGRAGTALAVLGPETLGSERESIAEFTPTGYNDGLWHRCHLIGAQLCFGTEIAENLVTGTPDMNTEKMLPVENAVADYIRETGNHVIYRVIPDFRRDELVCRGVTILAWSIEDDGFRQSVWCANDQVGVVIDYSTGLAWVEDEIDPTGEKFILNTKSRRFHRTDCGGATSIKYENRLEFIGDREILIKKGYMPCGTCNP